MHVHLGQTLIETAQHLLIFLLLLQRNVELLIVSVEAVFWCVCDTWRKPMNATSRRSVVCFRRRSLHTYKFRSCTKRHLLDLMMMHRSQTPVDHRQITWFHCRPKVVICPVISINHWWANPNHDLIEIMIESLVMIWFEYKRFDLETCDLIWWFEQITTFSNLGQGIMITLLVFLLQLS